MLRGRSGKNTEQEEVMAYWMDKWTEGLITAHEFKFVYTAQIEYMTDEEWELFLRYDAWKRSWHE